MYRQWGGDLINMSVLPEAKLAREAEIRSVPSSSIILTDQSLNLIFLWCSYALVATATDYDSWRPHSASVTAADVFQTLKANADTSRHVAATILEEMHQEIAKGDLLEGEKGGMKFSIMPRSGEQKEEDRMKLAYVLPEYFSD